MSLISHAVRRAAGLLARLGRDRSGAQAVTLALALLPILMGLAGGIDLARAYLVKARLNQALDAAALAGGRAFHLPGRDADIQQFFLANFDGFLKSELTSFEVAEIIEPNQPERLRLSASADVPTAFGTLFGLDRIPVGTVSEVTRQNIGLQLAMVLDNTGSMAGHRIQDLREASLELADILFGEVTSGPHPLLEIGVVPYSAAVNIGSYLDGMTRAEREMLIDYSGVPDDYDYDPGNDDRWKGCVEARATVGQVSTDPTVIDTGAHDLSVAPPTAALRWRPYRYPHHYDNQYAGMADAPIGDGSADGNDADDDDRHALELLDSGDCTGACRGAVHYPDTQEPQGGAQNGYRRADWGFGPYGELWPRADTDPTQSNDYTGPNIGCPAPILPLSNEYNSVRSFLETQLQAWFRGGTLGSVGLAWGWRMLDPAAPYENSVDYQDLSYRKAAIMMTDGVNQMFRWPQHNYNDEDGDGCDDHPLSPSGSGCGSGTAVPGQSDYGAFGRIGESGDNRLDVSSTTEGADEINMRMRKLCYAMKHASGDSDGRDDILIYTIIFGSVAGSGDYDQDIDPNTGLLATDDSVLDSDARLRKAYLECASGPDRYFLAPSGDDLRAAFRAIGNDLANLHISR